MQQSGALKQPYQQNPTPKVTQHATIQPEQHLKLSSFEKTLIVCGIAIVVGLMLAIVGVKNSINSSQRVLQDVTIKNSKVGNQNANMSQELDGMRNAAIASLAKQEKLSISDKNVRNITQ